MSLIFNCKSNVFLTTELHGLTAELHRLTTELHGVSSEFHRGDFNLMY